MKKQLPLFPEQNRPAKRYMQPGDGEFINKKRRANYRPSKSQQVRCKNCKWLRKKRISGRNIYKCELIGTSRSAASDIRLSYVCNRFDVDGPRMAATEPKKRT